MRICLVPDTKINRVFERTVENGGVVETNGNLTATNLNDIKTFLLSKRAESDANSDDPMYKGPCSFLINEPTLTGNYELQIVATAEEMGGDWSCVHDQQFYLSQASLDSDATHLPADIAGYIQTIHDNF